MNQKSQAKIWRRMALGTLALVWGTVGIAETPAASAGESLTASKIRGRGRVIIAPPLPTRDSIQQFDYYNNSIYLDSRRGHRRFRRRFRRRDRFGRHRRFKHHGHDRFHHRRRSRFRRRRGIIIKKKF
ncbi:MAG: hypothetical protein AAFQ80_24370 [Cyanobacteria bacterium J06621_8]